MTAQPSLIPNPEKLEHISFVVKSRVAGRRLDKYLTTRFEGYSRAYLQKWIKAGHVLVNGSPGKGSSKIRPGDRIEIALPALEEVHLQPENIPLEILYEDEDLAAINKPADLVIHPARGHTGGTLVNALLAHFGQLSNMSDVYRPGIVHRLDRFTTGVILVAKNNLAHAALARQFEERSLQKEYLALVHGEMKVAQDVIALPLGMDPKHRERMTVRHGGKAAITAYRVLEHFPGFTWVQAFPKTGRTHQIRVHLRALGHTLVADELYGAAPCLRCDDLQAGLEEPWQSMLARQLREAGLPQDNLIARQALHAHQICFTHPRSGQSLTLTAPLPADLQHALQALRIFRTVMQLRQSQT